MTKLAQRIDWWKVLKWLVLPVFIAVLYYQLTSLQQKPDLLNRLRVFLAEENIIIIVFVLPLLTFFNYALEAAKWQVLVKPAQRRLYSEALNDVLIGILFSVLTPERLGELAGRVVNLRMGNKLVGAASSLAGSIGQNIVIFFLGSVGFVFFALIIGHLGTWPAVGSLFLVFCLTGLFLFLFFNLYLLIPIVNRVSLPKRWKQLTEKLYALKDYSNTDLLKVLLFSLLRVAIWSCQYLIILWMLIPDIDWQVALLVSWIVFLIQTGIPLPPISSLVARSSIAIYLWSYIGISEWNALTASFVLYFNNLIIPSVVGLIVIYLNKKSFNANI